MKHPLSTGTAYSLPICIHKHIPACSFFSHDGSTFNALMIWPIPTPSWPCSIFVNVVIPMPVRSTTRAALNFLVGRVRLQLN